MGSWNKTKSCCGQSVQSPPAACCESHTIVTQTGVCFRPTCDTVAADGGFYLSFKNSCNQDVPLNAAEIFFYHAAAGTMRIISKKNDSYFVEVTDESKEGVIIAEDDCVLVAVVPSVDSNINPAARCVTGLFNAPALNAAATIFIHNGSGIPIGSTITFTWNGQTGSYEVTSYVSASGNTFTYTVTNTGSGHTPGTIVDGEGSGACSIPIEIVTEVDLCDLAEANEVDSITGCVNGSPRSFKSTSENDVISGTAEGGWGPRRLTNLDCCVTIDGCLKFSGASCPDDSDSVILRNINIDCFYAAYQDSKAKGQDLVMNIDGFKVLVYNYSTGTRRAYFRVAEDTTISPEIEFAEGSQVCLGECCASCTANATQQTDYQTILDPPESTSVFAFNGAAISHPAGVSYWLVGVDTSNVQSVQQLDSSYFANPSDNSFRFPRASDVLMLRQKMCNTSETGCRQGAKIWLSYQVGFDSLDSGVTVDWEIGALTAASATLSDDVTVNPFNNFIAGNAEASGRIEGPGAADGDLLNTPFGLGLVSSVKPFPAAAGQIMAPVKLYKCDCALTLVYCFLRVTAADVGSFMPYIGLQRYIEKTNYATLANPINDPDSEPWA